MVKILVTQPTSDYTTRYISAWANFVVDLAKKRRIDAVCLRSKRANRKEFQSVVMKTKPRFLFLNGHGNKRAVAGQDNEILVEVNNEKGILKEKIVYALACSSAKILGRKSVKDGTDAYLGYDEDFIFFYDEKCRTNPINDLTAKLFLDPSNAIPISLLKGHPAGRAYKNSQNMYKKTAAQLLGSQSSEDRTYLKYLIWNMAHQVCLGNKKAAI